jgi:HAD superfamily hydrolase (TIGR01509 family)
VKLLYLATIRTEYDPCASDEDARKWFGSDRVSGAVFDRWWTIRTPALEGSDDELARSLGPMKDRILPTGNSLVESQVGAVAQVAIYTEHLHHLSLLRKILLRMRRWESAVNGPVFWSLFGNNAWLRTRAPLPVGSTPRRFHHSIRTPTLEQWHALLNLEPISGIPELLERLDAANINVALASSASLQRIELSLNRLHLAHHVPIIVSATDIHHSKPAPDCYLRGAEILGIDPADCVAIEDAGNGVASAKAAGMMVIAYRAPISRLSGREGIGSGAVAT